VDTLAAIENATGSNAADQLWGDNGANVLSGGAGDDFLVGWGGADTLDGGAGTDTAGYYGAAAVVVDLLGNAAWDGGNVDTLAGIENAVGSGAADQLYGDHGANVLEGGAGNDFLAGWGGADRFVYRSTGDGQDTIFDFQAGAGGDALDIRALLVGYDPGNPDNFIKLTTPGADTVFEVDADGAANGANFVALATLHDVSVLLNDMLAYQNLLVA